MRWEHVLDDYFLLTQRGTSVGTEIRAGTTSFLTLSYLLLVNPQILQQAGVSHNDAVLATALSSAVACMIVGLCANLPFGCAPGLGLSAYLTFGLVQPEKCSLQQSLTLCWMSGVIVLLLAVTGLAQQVMHVVPHAIKYAIVVGMGLLIAMIGLVSVGMIVPNPKTLVELGPLHSSWELQLCYAGIILLASLLYHDVKGAILIGIAVLTIVVWTFQDSWPSTWTEMPRYEAPEYDVWDWANVLSDTSKASVLFPAVCSFCLICIFDISGVMFGLATLGGIINPVTGDVPGGIWAFVASAVGTIIAAWLGSTPIIVCVECASGVKEGGRTGLTAVVIGMYFVLSIFLAPLFSAVPDEATSPVLVLVGVLMMGESRKIDWDHMNQALPAFMTIIFMPLTYSITNGMILGLSAAIGFYVTTGQLWNDVRKASLCVISTSSNTDEYEIFGDEHDRMALIHVNGNQVIKGSYGAPA